MPHDHRFPTGYREDRDLRAETYGLPPTCTVISVLDYKGVPGALIVLYSIWNAETERSEGDHFLVWNPPKNQTK